MATKIKNTKNMDVISMLTDAITASGKKFSEIPKKTIFDFLERSGIKDNRWEEIYQKISHTFNKVEDKTVSVFTNEKVKNESLNDIVKRTPRKNIFSEIIKITG